MAPQPQLASRQRQLLRELGCRYQNILEGILPARELLQGSVYELRTRCGKPSCHCAGPDGERHRTTVLSWSQGGKTQLRSVGPEDRARLRGLTQNYRRFRQARAQLVRLHQHILRRVDGLARAVRGAPPRLAAKPRRRR